MRALVYHNHVLRLEKSYGRPDLQPGEALIKVLQAGICNTDLEMIRGYMDFQGVLGHEFVGIVEAVHEGPGATSPAYLIGKRVVGEINAACHRPDCFYCQQNMLTHCPNRTTLGILNRDGAFAEYLTLPTANLHLVPENVSDEEAVFVEPLAANFEMLEQVHIHPTEMVIVLGDGKMGQLAAQVLALTGCHVKMVGKHKEKLALAEQHGIETYLLADAEQAIAKGKRRADIVVECTGSAQGLELAMSMTRPRGTVILKSTVSDLSTLHLAPIVIDEIRVQGSRCGPFAPALRALSQRRIDVLPLISARYSLDDGLEAFGYAGQKGMLKVLVRV
ncbi:MAG TPA: alcohol dehydrogenase catalytic domain-containing protein [Ktedonobacteraceae bacterium]